MTDTIRISVKQCELREIWELEQDVAPKLKRIEELKSNVKAMLLHKMPVEFGRFDAYLITIPSRHPTWRQAVVEYLGQKFADDYKKSFPVTIRTEVRVEEHAVLPLWNGDGTVTDEPSRPAP